MKRGSRKFVIALISIIAIIGWITLLIFNFGVNSVLSDDLAKYEIDAKLKMFDSAKILMIWVVSLAFGANVLSKFPFWIFKNGDEKEK